MANVQDRGPPSTAAIAIGTSIISLLVGYYIGQARSIGLFGGSSTASAAATQVGRQPSDDEESDASDAESQSGVGELQSFTDSSEECKLVLVTRTDLGMTKGIAFRFRHTFTVLPSAAHTRARPVASRTIWLSPHTLVYAGGAAARALCRSSDSTAVY